MIGGPALAMLVVGGTFLGSTLAATVAWLRARERALRAEERLAALQSHRREPGAELEVVRALDAIAVEVERIGEGQRYVTNLLASRPLPDDVLRPALPVRRSAGRNDTPA